MGLVDKLRLAESDKVIKKLLDSGNSYVEVSKKTKRRWKAVSILRLKELRMQTEEKVVSEKKSQKKVKKTKV